MDNRRIEEKRKKKLTRVTINFMRTEEQKKNSTKHPNQKITRFMRLFPFLHRVTTALHQNRQTRSNNETTNIVPTNTEYRTQT